MGMKVSRILVRDIPASIKEANLLNSFKKLIKKWVPQTYPCRTYPCVRATYLALVFVESLLFSKCVVLLFILIISYTYICSNGPEMVFVDFNVFYFVLQLYNG